MTNLFVQAYVIMTTASQVNSIQNCQMEAIPSISENAMSLNSLKCYLLLRKLKSEKLEDAHCHP